MESNIIDSIMNAIQNVGFPIVICGVLAWYLNKSDTRHKQELDKLSEAVENNTDIMEKVLIHLEYIGKKHTEETEHENFKRD